MTKSLYEILEVEPDVSQQDLNDAYRRLARRHHPDRAGTSDRFIEINKAYAVLRDPAKRLRYDETEDRQERDATEEIREAHAILVGTLQAVILGAGKPISETDVVLEMRKLLRETIRQQDAALFDQERIIAGYRRLEGRIRRGGEPDNEFAALIKIETHKLAKALAQEQKALSAARRALIDLQQYASIVDISRSAQYAVFGGNSDRIGA